LHVIYSEIARRLEQKIGLGDFPLIARRFFSRLQRLVEQKGDGALQIIANVVEEASGPNIRSRNQYFGYVVKRRLTEQGYLIPQDQGANQTREQHQAEAEQAAKQRAELERVKQAVAKPVTDPPADLTAAELDRLKLSNELLRRELEVARRNAERGVR
jgi:hypothetical protein